MRAQARIWHGIGQRPASAPVSARGQGGRMEEQQARPDGTTSGSDAARPPAGEAHVPPPPPGPSALWSEASKDPISGTPTSVPPSDRPTSNRPDSLSNAPTGRARVTPDSRSAQPGKSPNVTSTSSGSASVPSQASGSASGLSF